MKLFFKILAFLILSIFILAVGSVVYIKTALPDVGPPPVIQVKATPELIARGEYLANSVSLCIECHSQRDWTRFAGPVKGTHGIGGEPFTQEYGLPGAYYSKNLTPAHLGDWTDGEIYRAIKSGVNKDGKPLFPIMPYPNFNQMAERDVMAIIAYLRTLPAVENEVPESSSDFPMNIIIHTIPQPSQKMKTPPREDQIAYGKYLTTIASCSDCHSPQEHGQLIPGLYMAGNTPFEMPTFGTVRSANLTPDPEFGIGLWTEGQFVNRFKAYADSAYVAHEVKSGEFQTVMPWSSYATMEEEDLRAIFAYLKSLEPVSQEVTRFVAEM